MKVSVVIPTRNREHILKETVQTLMTGQNYPIEKVEIIVVNDGEEELSETAKLELDNVKIIKNELSGVCSARNTGAKHANNELLIFIDDDILLTDNHISRHVELHQKYQDVLITGKWIYTEEFIDQMSKTPFGRFKLNYDYTCMGGIGVKEFEGAVLDADTLASFCLSVKKEVFEKVGGFDEHFPYAGAEDQELSRRARKMGYRLLYDPENICYHNEKDRLVLLSWLERQYRGVMGFVYFSMKDPENKKRPLYYENTPISSTDPFKLKLKKIGKIVLSNSLSLSIINSFVPLLEKMGFKDPFLFRLYNVMAGLYIYKGFSVSYKKMTSSS